jgi:hypothetical protein
MQRELIKKGALSTIALNLILHNSRIKQKIADACSTSYWTVHRWSKNNDVMLTTACALKVIREETGLSDSEILTESSAA